MAVARSLCAGALCAALAVSSLVLPRAARADSNGVPPVDGAWVGKLVDIYWDQTSKGSVRPKQSFRTKVDADINQDGGDVTLTIVFDHPFPIDGASALAQIVLEGSAGNYHVNAGMSGVGSATFSGSTNRAGTTLVLTGFVASNDFTHQVTIKLKKSKNQ